MPLNFRTLLYTFPWHGSLADNGNKELAIADQSRAFGDYQYYLSFGGDQYLNIPAAVDGIIGVSGLYRQMGHALSQPSFESAGYTAMGRTTLKDKEYRL
jgi:hypothetical protein